MTTFLWRKTKIYLLAYYFRNNFKLEQRSIYDNLKPTDSHLYMLTLYLL